LPRGFDIGRGSGNMVFTGIVEDSPKFGVHGQCGAVHCFLPGMGEVVSVERKASFDLLGQVGTCFKLYGRIDFETALLFLFELL
jgi:hypothetical protein